MNELREIFNNREIAIGIWALIAVIFSAFTKPIRQFLKSVLPILFSRKFIVFYIVYLSYFVLVTYSLYSIGFWDISLLKDTIFWVVFVELPLFAKTIEKANGNHFFTKLIKDNIALFIILEFVLNFWTFELISEIFIVPIAILFGFLYGFAAIKKEFQEVKRFFDRLFIIFGVLMIINTVTNIFQSPEEFLNISTLKEFLLPILLLFLNLPIVYGLALYNIYEQVFIRVKGNKREKIKIKRRIFGFAGIHLSKITALRNHAAQTLVISLTEMDMKVNLDKLEKRLSMQVGENYMKRTRFYVIWCIICVFSFTTGLILSNSQVSLKEILTFNFSLDITRIKDVITYICSTGIVISFCCLIFSIGLRKKKYEEISQVKKYSLHNLLFLIKRQYSMLQEFPPIDNPKELFVQYIIIAYELKSECDKTVTLFDNLLTTWELDTLKQLQLSITTLVYNIGIDEAEINLYTPDRFHSYFLHKKSVAPQSEKINVFIYDVQKGIEKYIVQIKLCFEEFKNYI